MGFDYRQPRQAGTTTEKAVSTMIQQEPLSIMTIKGMLILFRRDRKDLNNIKEEKA